MAHSLRAQKRFPLRRQVASLSAAGILAWAADARAGFDGWRGDLNGLYESSHPALLFYSDRLAPVTGLSGWSDWRWHWIRSGIWIEAGIEGEFLSSLDERDYRLSRGGIEVRELNLGVPFGDSATGAASEIQIGIFPVRVEEDADLFGNYVARYEPYPGVIPYYPWTSDSLGSTSRPGQGARIALGAPASPLRSEFLALWDMGDVHVLGYVDGTTAKGLGWSLGAGWRHALASDTRHRIERRRVWAKTDSGYLPIGYAQNAGLAYSDSGGITARGWSFSARLRWIHPDGPAGRFGAFAEAALLGWADQPLYYEDRWRRGAATVGAYLPTAGWLQVCLVQAEWRPAAYHANDALRARPELRYWIAAEPATPWSFAALLGRDFGRHWALRGRFEYAPRGQSQRMYVGYAPETDPISYGFERGRREWAFQVRALFRFGRRR